MVSAISFFISLTFFVTYSIYLIPNALKTQLPTLCLWSTIILMVVVHPHYLSNFHSVSEIMVDINKYEYV